VKTKKKTKTVRSNKSKLREERANNSAPNKLLVNGKIDRTIEFCPWFDRTWQERLIRIECNDEDHIVQLDIDSSLFLRETAAWLTRAAEWVENQEDNK
jgi:CO dehydrogenase nickel-insertion accessory protein CooC1